MAEFSQSQGANKRIQGKPRCTRHPLRVDLTPMVDLAFLLITFFMLTTMLGDLKKLDYDKRIGDDSTAISECRVLNILVDSFDRVYAYDGFALENMKKTSLDREGSLRKLIISKAEQVKSECGNGKDGKPHTQVCLIKLLSGARFQNMINVIDEMNITGTGTYSLQDPDDREIAAIRALELTALNDH